MLTELFVKNLALIQEVRLDLKPGFCVLSGETGAGKSLLVESLRLILGAKASPTLIRTGEKEAWVEAVFEVPQASGVLEYLEEAGLKEGDELIIRRQISAQGKNRIFANGQSITLSQLQIITQPLVDLTAQHHQQSLMNQDQHLDLYDLAIQALETSKAESELIQLKNSYIQVYQEYTAARKDLKETQSRIGEREQRLEFLKFQLEEIQKAQLKDPEEEENLAQEKKRVKNSENIYAVCDQIQGELSDKKNSVLEIFEAIIQKLEKLADVDETLKQGLEQFSQVRDLTQDLYHQFQGYHQDLEFQPGRLDAIESRLYVFHQLKRKYGTSLAEVLETQSQMETEVHELENSQEVLAEKEKKVKQLTDQVLVAAEKLSQYRQKFIKPLGQKIQKELKDLSMPQVQFQVSFEAKNRKIEKCDADGYDTIYFEFSANPGEPAKPLSQIASGGELSRLLLALKQILGNQAYPMTYIFDEVDTGIGGAVAQKVGEKLKEISQNNQVLCVTHLPQVAALGDQHYVIEKEVEKQKTKTGIRFLKNSKDREMEIARMLGGVEITSKTKAHAREMLKQ